MKELFRLYLNDEKSEYILFSIHKNGLINDLYQNTYITFHGTKNLYITYDWLYTSLNRFLRMLSLCINNKLLIDNSINKDLGYFWNNYLKGITFDLIFENNIWIGEKYLLYSTNDASINSGSAWLYNDQNKIIFEITPSYPFLFRKPRSKELFISFENWMKKYMPLKICQISHKTAESWNVQLQAFINLSEKQKEK